MEEIGELDGLHGVRQMLGKVYEKGFYGQIFVWDLIGGFWRWKLGGLCMDDFGILSWEVLMIGLDF